ncbi:MAG TPA: hypothetical protein PLK93_01805 [Clostridiales bacterium]|nr:hypothetical protein [Clostridiales bacterium]
MPYCVRYAPAEDGYRPRPPPSAITAQQKPHTTPPTCRGIPAEN